MTDEKKTGMTDGIELIEGENAVRRSIDRAIEAITKKLNEDPELIPVGFAFYVIAGKTGQAITLDGDNPVTELVGFGSPPGLGFVLAQGLHDLSHHVFEQLEPEAAGQIKAGVQEAASKPKPKVNEVTGPYVLDVYGNKVPVKQ